ncbi:MAG: redoxin domain-containing protein [Longimicrobiales bacterium]|nr:redoxin domain-containing protein [Longimicrobiales bacterium]
MSLQIGDPAPDFALVAEPGADPVSLADFRGESPVVVLFFPLAFSSVCTDELCGLAADWSAWEALDAAVLGISIDSPFVTLKFREETGVPFPLLSDFNREASKAYDVLYEEFFGMHGVSKRAAFVVDRDGSVRYAWVSEDAGVMPDFDAIKGVLAGL